MSDISDFTTKDMSDMLYEDLSEIEDVAGTKTEVVLIQPTTESVFPCRVLSTPLENVDITQNAVPIRKTFLKTAYGTNYAGLLEHFLNYGMKEGRQASSEFNVQTYRNNYSDLQKAYGTNYKKYFKHYVIYGNKEGRKCV